MTFGWIVVAFAGACLVVTEVAYSRAARAARAQTDAVIARSRAQSVRAADLLDEDLEIS